MSDAAGNPIQITSEDRQNEMDKRALAEQIRQLQLKLDTSVANNARIADQLLKKQNELATVSIQLDTTRKILEDLHEKIVDKSSRY